jgi:hypothetical protein
MANSAINFISTSKICNIKLFYLIAPDYKSINFGVLFLLWMLGFTFI